MICEYPDCTEPVYLNSLCYGHAAGAEAGLPVKHAADSDLVSNKPITKELVTSLYYKYRIARYLLEHPGADYDKAYKYARVAWARKQKMRQKRTGRSL